LTYGLQLGAEEINALLPALGFGSEYFVLGCGIVVALQEFTRINVNNMLCLFTE